MGKRSIFFCDFCARDIDGYSEDDLSVKISRRVENCVLLDIHSFDFCDFKCLLGFVNTTTLFDSPSKENVEEKVYEEVSRPQNEIQTLRSKRAEVTDSDETIQMKIAKSLQLSSDEVRDRKGVFAKMDAAASRANKLDGMSDKELVDKLRSGELSISV